MNMPTGYELCLIQKYDFGSISFQMLRSWLVVLLGLRGEIQVCTMR